MQFIILLCMLLVPVSGLASVHHELTVTVEPQKRSLKVIDRVSFPANFLNNQNRSVKFLLHEGLALSAAAEQIKDSEGSKKEAVPVNLYQVHLPEHVNYVELTYHGTIYQPVQKMTEEYAGDFSAGIIDEAGVFMAGPTH